jgi:hypothetical protein
VPLGFHDSDLHSSFRCPGRDQLRAWLFALCLGGCRAAALHRGFCVTPSADPRPRNRPSTERHPRQTKMVMYTERRAQSLWGLTMLTISRPNLSRTPSRKSPSPAQEPTSYRRLNTFLFYVDASDGIILESRIPPTLHCQSCLIHRNTTIYLALNTQIADPP